MVSSEGDHRREISYNWDFSTPFEPTPLEAKYCVPTARYQAKLAATWSAMAPTGEEEGEIFGEFEVSKEDLSPARSSPQNETRRGSTSSECLHATSNSPPGLITSCPDSLQIKSEPCAKSPSCTSAHHCEQTSDHASDPPLSPSVDGSNDSPALASSFTFAGWESQDPAQHVASEAAEQDDAESCLIAKNKQPSIDACTKSKDSRGLTLSIERQQELQSAQPASDSLQPISSPTLQLDLTQQLDTRQLAPGCAVEIQQDYSSRRPGAARAPTEATCLSRAFPMSSSGQHASKSSPPICRDNWADSSQCLLPGSNTYQKQPSRHGPSSLGADQMQHRPLSGFLTPLGKLAGMFGWTPGKPNANHRPLDRAQMSQAAVALDHVHLARKQLTELARPTNSADVPQEVSAGMLQVKPHHLMLQDLQKAADLLSPRSMPGVHGMQHSPSYAMVSSCLDQSDAQGSSPAEQKFPQQPRGQIIAIAEKQLPAPLDANSDGSPDPELPDVSPKTGRDAVTVELHGNTISLTQDDNDILAAALASRLAVMAPHVSSLHSKHGTSNAIDANKSEYQGKAWSPKRKRSEEEPMQPQDEMQCTGVDLAEQPKIGKAQRHNQAVQHVSQQCPSDLAKNARKRFCRTTGLEVLQRCMPSFNE